MEKFLVTIIGPTASGKTKISLAIASHFKTEIISADARQFYREMSIGTAKPTVQELKSVIHHFIDHLSVDQEYSAGDFEKDAISKLDEIFAHHDIAVMTGGSGLFIDSVLHGLDAFPEVDERTEEDLEFLYMTEGIAGLQKLLKNLDPVYYRKVDLNNSQRLLRALGVCISSGEPYSSFRKKTPIKRGFHPIIIGLKVEREQLYKDIDLRVDKMMESGLLEETKKLFPFRNMNALQTVGYKELFDFLLGMHTLDEAVSLIKQHTRNYAKRQMTWFRKNKNITWFDAKEIQKIIRFIKSEMNRYKKKSPA